MTTTQLDSLSNGQRDALTTITKWFNDGGSYPLTLGGLAGTGKTTLVSLLPEVLPGTQIICVAYTGKAVSVLKRKLHEHGDQANSPVLAARLHDAGDRASTIHRLLYQPSVATICLVSNQFIPGKNATRCQMHKSLPDPCPTRQQISFTPMDSPLAGISLVVADEASMIPEKLWQDLTSHGVPVLAVGDHGQLPPVRSSFNLMSNPDIRLEEIHRQNADNPSGMAILNVARWAREQGHIPHGWYGPDVVKIQPHEIGRTGMHPRDSDLIICATNATRIFHNMAMRAEFGRSGPPAEGDSVICLRNNYDQGLFNGQRGIITEIGENVLIKNELATEITIELDGLDTPWTGDVSSVQFGQESTLSTLDRKLALFDFGYACTCHKSQGSEADNVIVIEESWPKADRERWLYTSVTRAKKRLTIVGW